MKRPPTAKRLPLAARVLICALALALSACSVGSGSQGGSGTTGNDTAAKDGITIDADVFAYDESAGVSNETFVVSGATDQAAVVSALVKVGSRFMLVDQTGTEHHDQASLDDALVDDLYTPNYVSDPEVTKDGVELYIDCKGGIEDPMAQTFRTILREELTAAGIKAHVRAVTT